MRVLGRIGTILFATLIFSAPTKVKTFGSMIRILSINEAPALFVHPRKEIINVELFLPFNIQSLMVLNDKKIEELPEQKLGKSETEIVSTPIPAVSPEVIQQLNLNVAEKDRYKILNRKIKKIQANVDKKLSLKTQVKAGKHNFKFDFKAVNSQAVIDYDGLVNAQIVYKISNNDLNVRITESLSSSTQLIVSHNSNRADSLSMVQVNYGW